MSRLRHHLVSRALRISAGATLAGLGVFVGGGTLIVAAGACSLGDGVTPDCDASLPAGEEGACQGKANCDDGKGGVLATEGCCLDASRQLLEICVQENVADDWRTACGPDPAQLSGAVCTVTTGEMDDKTPNVTVNNATLACDMANDVFSHCLAGGLLFSGGGVGGNGTGGMGVGGMGTGGMGTGGAGGG